MLNGLSLFTGIGGIDLALREWVRPVLYCEIERYAQGVLLSQISRGSLPYAPIWDDIRTLRGDDVGSIDIIYGGFPCQDISVAGAGAGLGGERSGLFHHIARLVSETNPRFVFLENVPAIRTRGLNSVCQTFTELGYNCRWTIVSAAEVGAPHLRKRWFMLAYASEFGHSRGRSGDSRAENGIRTGRDTGGLGEVVANTLSARCGVSEEINERQECVEGRDPFAGGDWWLTEPNVGRVVNGLPFRMERIRALGNAVVPLQAREAFMRLGGLK